MRYESKIVKCKAESERNSGSISELSNEAVGYFCRNRRKLKFLPFSFRKNFADMNNYLSHFFFALKQKFLISQFQKSPLIVPHMNGERGNILFTSLLMMMAMNLLAITLVQKSVKESNVATYNEAESTGFYLSESCIDEMVSWFESLDRPPTALPHTITKNNISHLYSGSESQSSLGRLNKYSYNCNATSIIIKSTEAKKTNTAENIAVSDGYGASGDLRPEYYYQINSTASGPDNTQKRIFSIVSVEY